MEGPVLKFECTYPVDIIVQSTLLEELELAVADDVAQATERRNSPLQKHVGPTM
jgi:hypothetical protein